jgi:hypothetical protein
MSLFYDMDGKPMTLQEWAKAFEETRHIGQTTVGNAEVSTVWLSSDHQFGDGPPLIFETMIFGGPHDQFCERYSTKEEAAAGHKRFVLALQEGRDPEEDR